MRLEKWYADVAGGGSLVVHYGASLDIGPVAIGYDGELRSGGERRGSFSLGRNARLPRGIGGDDGSASLAVSTADGPATWRNAIHRPRTLWSDGRRQVLWDPVVLNGEVSGARTGRGYAEQLVLTVAPWRLGITRLWWGRFWGGRPSVGW